MTIIPFLNRIIDLILNPIILFLFSLSFIYFMYGIVRFLRMEVGDGKRKEAQDAILWGIIGMVIMFSVYGIIEFVMATFGATPSGQAGLYLK